ncbi:MAG: two-component system sensor histidine kinase/response regulator [Verrucomicrobiales bacterium]
MTLQPGDVSAAEAALGTVVGLQPGHQEIRVIIAEDQPINRLLMHKLLDKAGFTLEDAEDGVVAVEKWREWRPHLIFMDEEMPRMLGTEATRTIMNEAGENAPEAGCVDMLSKPFKRDDLFEMIALHFPVCYTYEATQLAA